jgi:L-ascorbate metabolism protein UlaG (beta-lactamase superfamily)
MSKRVTVVRLLKKTLLILLAIVALLSLATALFMQHKTFGKHPAADRQERILRSPHYKNGSFQNVYPTEVTLKSTSTWKILKDYVNKPALATPPKALPSVKTDLGQLKDDTPTIVWFGHSSYLIKHKGVRILVDPVFSGNASPVSFFGKSFPGSDVYGTSDFDSIDLLILSHDHYDHLDYQTIRELAPKVKAFYTPLGVGAHLEHWGVPAGKITELDWWEQHVSQEGIGLRATPARHFSGRGFSRGKTQWSSFVLQLPGYRLFLGGDSGYDDTFKTIGQKYGPFDVALLEAGQYGDDWPYIHMLPEQTVQAALDLKAKVLLPVHWAKFLLANHDWNEPVRRVVARAHEKNLRVTTPLIGEAVVLDSIYPATEWWNF